MAASIRAVRADQPAAATRRRAAPAHRPACRRACRRCGVRLRIDQVGEALDAGQIELAVLEGAAGELTGLGQSAGP